MATHLTSFIKKKGKNPQEKHFPHIHKSKYRKIKVLFKNKLPCYS